MGTQRKIAIVNNKGGVGKTTSVRNIASALSHQNKSVLMWDLDSQANLSRSCGLGKDSLTLSTFEVLKGEAEIRECMISLSDSKNYLIPADLTLSGFDMISITGKELLLKRSIKKAQKKGRLIDSFDYMLFDCPPNMGSITANVLAVADEVFIPVEPEFFSLDGISTVFKAVEIAKENLDNEKLRVTGIFATKFDGRNKHHKEGLGLLKQYFDEVLFDTVIRKNIALSDANSHGQSIFEYDARAVGAKDYFRLRDEIVKMGAGI
jgi:chromosome partitioning protein